MYMLEASAVSMHFDLFLDDGDIHNICEDNENGGESF